jgi:hypothetical protein
MPFTAVSSTISSCGSRNCGRHNNGGSGCNIIGSPTELAFENEKLQMQLGIKDKELAMQQREIEYLKELNELLKSKTTS